MGHCGFGVALLDDVARTVFAAPALRGYTQVELDVVKAFAFTGVLGNLFVGYAVADADDHGEMGSKAIKLSIF